MNTKLSPIATEVATPTTFSALFDCFFEQYHKKECSWLPVQVTQVIDLFLEVFNPENWPYDSAEYRIAAQYRNRVKNLELTIDQQQVTNAFLAEIAFENEG